jgi:hypothetical protein
MRFLPVQGAIHQECSHDHAGEAAELERVKTEA